MGNVISIKTAVAICLSAILGDTLFAVSGVPIAQAGFGSIFAYVIVAIFAVLVAIMFGELSAVMPNEKGLAYSYVHRVFGTELGFITGILLYMGYLTTISAVSFSFGSYFLALLNISSIPLQIFIAICLILGISFLNTLGLKETTKLSGVLIGITLLTAVAFVAFAFLHQPSIPSNFVNSPVQDGFTPFEAAITAVVFAYAGFQTVVSLTKNVKGKGAGVKKVMVYSLLISAVVYIAVTFALMTLVPASQFTLNSSPLTYALHYSNAPQYITTLITVGSLVAIAASIITLIMISSRLIYQMGVDGLLPQITKKYDISRDVAVNGIWISAAIEIVVLFSGNIYTMLSISNFGIILSWLMGVLALLNISRRTRSMQFKIPYYPYTMIIAIFGCIFFLFGLPKESLAIGVVLILLLLVIYYTVIELKYKKVNRVRLF